MTYNIIGWAALDQKVLVVATKRVEGAWAAYCKNVPGKNHMDELEDVCAYGSKLYEPWARAIFPHIEGPYAR